MRTGDMSWEEADRLHPECSSAFDVWLVGEAAQGREWRVESGPYLNWRDDVVVLVFLSPDVPDPLRAYPSTQFMLYDRYRWVRS